MPYEIIWETRGVYRRYYGHTTDLDVSDSVYKTHTSPQFDELRYVILDFLGVTGFEVTNSSFIDERAALDSAASLTNPNIKVAIVAVDPGIITLAEKYASHGLTPYPTQIYSNLADARDWAAVSLPMKSRYRKLM